MKWTYRIRDKIKAALSLGVVFFLVLGTNMMNEKNFSELQDSFTTIYKDRLLVENYIYKLSVHLNGKLMLIENYSRYPGIKMLNVNHDNSINDLIDNYESTKFTDAERIYFDKFKEDLKQLHTLENLCFRSDVIENNLQSEIEMQYETLSKDLDALSDIQISESRRIIDNSNRIIHSSHLTSDLEIGILIVIGIFIQALIFSSNTLKPNFNQRSNLN